MSQSKIHTAPVAQKMRHKKTLHGISRKDDYNWLRDKDWQSVIKTPSKLNPDIKKYLKEENNYTQKVMTDTKGLQTTLFKELKGRIKDDDSSVPSKDGEYYYYVRYKKKKQYPVFCRYKSAIKNEQVLLDCNILADKKKFFDIGDCEHSPDHRYLAYCIDDKGSEFYTLQIFDLVKKVLLKDKIKNIQGEIVWAQDSQTLFYTQLDKNHRPDSVFRHKIGASINNDTMVYKEKDSAFFVALDSTESGKFITITSHDHVTSEVYLVNAKKPEQLPVLVEPRKKNVEYDITDNGDYLYILTNADRCKNFKLMFTPINKLAKKNWRDLYVPKKGTLLCEMGMFRDYLITEERIENLPQLNISLINNDGNLAKTKTIKFEEDVYELEYVPGYEFKTDNMRFSYTSMTTPRQIIDYNMRTNKKTIRKIQEVPSGHDPSQYQSKRLFAKSKDNKKIPISILYHKKTPIDGTSPLLLYGYGAYGNITPASFSTHRLSLVNRGFIYAIAHVRGGMEKGYAWYEDGKLKNKKNTFSDFLTCADFLIKNNYAVKGNIAIHGGSAGGMLIGAAINMRPNIFKAAVADVPFVDVLNTICDDSLPLTPPEWLEWGNPIEDSHAYQYIASYSPYDNIKQQKYPHVLVTAGVTDPRVTYWEPAKWVAKLRSLKTDNNLLLLKTNMSAGHAGVSGRYEMLKEIAFMYAFILKIFDQIE
ncbi:MAG: S9 family peptidase [Pseudomonadota bacterium]